MNEIAQFKFRSRDEVKQLITILEDIVATRSPRPVEEDLLIRLQEFYSWWGQAQSAAYREY